MSQSKPRFCLRWVPPAPLSSDPKIHEQDLPGGKRNWENEMHLPSQVREPGIWVVLLFWISVPAGCELPWEQVTIHLWIMRSFESCALRVTRLWTVPIITQSASHSGQEAAFLSLHPERIPPAQEAFASLVYLPFLGINFTLLSFHIQEKCGTFLTDILKVKWTSPEMLR